MFRTFLASLFAVGLLSAPAFAADDTYTIKLYKSKTGDKTEYEKVDTGKTTTTTTANGETKKEEQTEGLKEVFTEEILEKKEGDRRGTKLTRTYAVAEKTENGETKKAVYSGETVQIEKKGDKY